MEIWTQEERAYLDATLNRLIPANRDRQIPGAGELGVADFLSREANANADLRDAISALLAKATELACAAELSDGMTPDAVRQLESALPLEFKKLLVATYKGYYSRPDMRACFGLAAHPVHPVGYDVPPEPPEVMVELTAPVRARGAFYRDPTR